MAFNNLPPLREIIQRFGLSARKRFGQNYLLDGNLNRKIAKAIAPADQQIIEIGAGPGGLTRALLAEKAAHILAIEYDRRFTPALKELAQYEPSRLTLLETDALTINPQQFQAQKIVGNLPFNIATALLARCLMTEEPAFESLTVLVQKEVAERIIAKPDSRLYGRLSLLCQFRGSAKIHFTVPASAFTPRPKVHAALVHISVQPKEDDPKPQTIEMISRLAFQHRRKMLRTSLKHLTEVMEKADIKPTLRAEQVSVASYRRLAKIVEADGLVL